MITLASHRAAPGIYLGIALLGTQAGACATKPAADPDQQAQLMNAIAPPARPAPPESLPESARVQLGPHMVSHARDMADLMSAVMVLRYSEVETRANNLATEAHVAPAHSPDGSPPNGALPDKFVVYEREMRVMAAALASAAHERQPFMLAHAYGQLSETCVKCHATYRPGR